MLKTGFSLLETLVTLALVGGLMVMALPSLQKHLWAQRRTDAQLGLGAVAMAQSARRLAGQAHTDDWPSLKLSPNSPQGHYQLVIHLSETGYKAQAEAPDAPEDEPCRQMWLALANEQMSTGPAGCWP